MNTFDIEFMNIMKDFTASPHNAFIQKLRKAANQYPLILYGCSEVGKKIVQVCLKNNIRINAVSDTYRRGQFQGFNIVSPEDLCNSYKNGMITITSNNYKMPIRSQLTLMGFDDLKMLSVPFTINQYVDIQDFKSTYLDGYCWAYNFFEDNISNLRVKSL